MSADQEPPDYPGPWHRPVPAQRKTQRWEEIGASRAGVLQILKVTSILALILMLLRSFMR